MTKMTVLTHFVLTRHGFTRIDGASTPEEAKRIYCDIHRAPESAVWNVRGGDDTLTFHRNPTQAEINFGHGVTHYRDFPLREVLTAKGHIKKWFVSRDDGLRYYR